MDRVTKDKIRALRQVLKSLQPIKPETQRKLDQKFRLEFNYNSNHLEGNTLTYGETKLLLIFGQTNGTHPYRDYEEMTGHDVAYKRIQGWAKDKDHHLTEADIRNLNEIILVKPFWKDAIAPDGQSTKRQIKVGLYKEYPNSVVLQNGEIFEYASVSDTPFLMGELMDWYRLASDGDDFDPVTVAALLHYRFVRIHPFDDGNGRISRLLLNYVLLKNDLPPVIIKSEEKKNYLAALNRADSGDLIAFVEYIAEQLIWSLEISIKAAKGEGVDEPNDWEKQFSLYHKKLTSTGFDQKNPIRINLNSVKQVVYDAIFPLIHDLEDKLALIIDRFFYERRNMVIVSGKHFIGATFNKLMLQDQPVSFADFLDLEFEANRLIQLIEYQVSYIGIKQLRRESVNLMPVRLAVKFTDYSYEIVNNGESLISKYYDESISQSERAALIDRIGSNILKHYEQIIGDKRLS